MNSQVENLAKTRIGEKRTNTFGSMMEIVEYKGWNEIYVKFEKGEPVPAFYGNFKKGKVKSPYDKSVFGVGYLGEGKYKPSENDKPTLQYKTWKGMLQRCYYEIDLEKNPSYTDVFVCDEWCNFQTFASWFDENYYQVEGEILNLDKDILIKGNKTYSPETCVFTPKTINTLFIKQKAVKSNLPIGVRKHSNKYVVYAEQRKGKSKYVGIYNSPEEAFEAYKTCKEKVIKQVAEEYKDKIPERLYEALITYEVEITD